MKTRPKKGDGWPNYAALCRGAPHGHSTEQTEAIAGDLGILLQPLSGGKSELWKRMEEVTSVN